MQVIIVIALLLFNFGISWLNAWGCGTSWNDTKKIGGIPHFLNWCGAVMSACGFTWCYLLILGFLAFLTGNIDEKGFEGLFSLGYLVIIGPVLGSGLAITIHSWVEAYKRRTLGSVALAGYNTLAEGYDAYRAVKDAPGAFESVMNFFFPKKDTKRKGGMTVIVLLLLIVALAGGCLTTYKIVRVTAAKRV